MWYSVAHSFLRVFVVILAVAWATGCSAPTSPLPVVDSTDTPDVDVPPSDGPVNTAPYVIFRASAITGPYGYETTLSARCQAAPGTHITDVRWYGFHGPVDQAVVGVSSVWEGERTIAVDRRISTYIMCLDSGGGVYPSRTVNLDAQPPMAVTPRPDMPLLQVHQEVGMPLASLLTSAATVSINRPSDNIARASIRNDSLIMVGNGAARNYSLQVQGSSPFGTVTLSLSGLARENAKLHVLTNVTSKVTFMDATGMILLESQGTFPTLSIPMEDIPDGVEQLVVRAVDDSRFERRIPFRKPESGSQILMAASIPKAPCREWVAAWGHSMESCIDLLVETLFPVGQDGLRAYMRLESAMTGVPVTAHSLNGVILGVDWFDAIQDARSRFSDAGMPVYILPSATPVSATSYLYDDGRVWPRDPFAYLLPDDVSNVSISYRYVEPHLVRGAIVRLPVSEPPSFHAVDLSRALFRAFFPFEPGPQFLALSTPEQSWFMREVLFTLRQLDQAPVNLKAGVPASHALPVGDS